MDLSERLNFSQGIRDLRKLKNFIAPIKVPIIDWLPLYTKQLFFNDLIAGLTVFVLLIPQGMAYSILAGMPPVYGLYSATLPVIIYAILGTSRQLSMGPMAITSLLIGTSAGSLGYTSDNLSEYITIIMNISMLCGLVLFLLGIFRLGILANFLSYSVLTGFMTASALLISLSQLKYILGITVPRFSYTHQTIIFLLTHLNECNAYALLVGLTAWILLYLVKIWKKRNKPTTENITSLSFRVLSALANMSSLISIFIGSIVAYGIISSNKNIQIVGKVPAGLQTPYFAFIDFQTLMKLFPSAVVIALISFSGNWAVALKFASINHYEVDATQELIAQGFSNIIGVFFNSFVVSGGLARSAVNAESGAKTQMSGIFSAVFIIIALELFTPIFYYIPMAILGAIIEVSVASMIDFEEMVKAYYIDKKDCVIMIVSFMSTFFIGISEGVLIGVVLSIAVVLNSTGFPQIVHLGKLPQSQGGHWKDIRRFRNAAQIPRIAIIRMDASLYFANSSHFKEVVLAASQGKFHSDSLPIILVILDVSAWIDIDLSGINCLVDIHQELIKRDVQLSFAYAKGRLRDRLKTAKFVEKLGEQYINMSIDDAIRMLPSRRSTLEIEKEAIESNYDFVNSSPKSYFKKSISVTESPMHNINQNLSDTDDNAVDGIFVDEDDSNNDSSVSENRGHLHNKVMLMSTVNNERRLFPLATSKYQNVKQSNDLSEVEMAMNINSSESTAPFVNGNTGNGYRKICIDNETSKNLPGSTSVVLDQDDLSDMDSSTNCILGVMT